MTPKEKAIELVNKFCKQTEAMFHASELVRSEWMKICKQCALIAVDEILKAIDWHEFETPNNDIEFWQAVKTEIENL